VEPILELSGLTKVYPGGLKALDDVDLTIRKGEIFALLGPNGAGKTTLIGAVCGLVKPSGGTIRAFGHDLACDWRRARARIGLVPQELSTDMFEPVKRAVSYSRGLFGLPPDPARIEEILRSLKNVNARIRFVRWVDMDDEKSLVPDEHLSILAAIRKRDKQMALERISNHIQMRMTQIHANLKEGYSRIYMGGGTA
jgi:ABC-type phosphate/phosphonate transport system ATPase subunit